MERAVELLDTIQKKPPYKAAFSVNTNYSLCSEMRIACLTFTQHNGPNHRNQE